MSIPSTSSTSLKPLNFFNLPQTPQPPQPLQPLSTPNTSSTSSTSLNPQHLLNNHPVIAQSGYLMLSAKLVFLFQPFVEMPLG